MTLNPNQQASLSLDSLADLKIVCDQLPFIKPGPSNPNTDPNSQLFKPLDSYINPPGTSPANPGQTVNAVEQHKTPALHPTRPSRAISHCLLIILARAQSPNLL
ncbi:hypothetical protein H4Q26_008236 [Puccinia striiformis f. sp. tritici PST-130]|nr:hypothetical protein H4Q26_008236 [Puccinia striiformis f. sp. tritici PST-130]